MKSRIHIHRLLWIVLLIAGSAGSLLLSFCTNSTTPTQGKLQIVIDESFQPLIDSEVDVFENLYKYSNIETIYKREVM